MAVFTVTTTPQLIWKSKGGDRGIPDNISIRESPAATGNVFIAQTASECSSSTSYYFTANDIVNLDLHAGQEIWVCTSAGEISIRLYIEGPDTEAQVVPV